MHALDLGLNNQRVVVTGSSQGIGLAIVRAFLQEGARVVMTGRNAQTLTAQSTALSHVFDEERIATFAGDLGEENKVIQLLKHMEHLWGGVDHLVCNIGSGRSVPPLQEDGPEWERMLALNLLNAVTVVRVFQSLLAESARERNHTASITLIGSICGMAALGCPVAYAAAKAAVESYAKGIARPLGPHGVRVNLVSPGNILFPGSTWENKLAGNAQGVEDMLNKEVALQRLGAAEEVGSVVVFLASDQAGFITGANWVVDGGQLR